MSMPFSLSPGGERAGVRGETLELANRPMSRLTILSPKNPHRQPEEIKRGHIIHHG